MSTITGSQKRSGVDKLLTTKLITIILLTSRAYWAACSYWHYITFFVLESWTTSDWPHATGFLSTCNRRKHTHSASVVMPWDGSAHSNAMHCCQRRYVICTRYFRKSHARNSITDQWERLIGCGILVQTNDSDWKQKHPFFSTVLNTLLHQL